MIPPSYKPRRKFMELAVSEAKRAGDRGDYPIGAVITRLTGRREVVIASAGNRVKTSGSSIKHVELETLKYVSSGYGRYLPDFVLYSTHEPCAMCAGACVWSTIGERASSPAGSSSRRAITPYPSPAVFSEKNAKSCSLTELRIGNGCELDFPPHAMTGSSLGSITSILVDRSPFAPCHQSQFRPWWIRQHRDVLQEVSIWVIEEYGSGGTPGKDDRLVSRLSPAP